MSDDDIDVALDDPAGFVIEKDHIDSDGNRIVDQVRLIGVVAPAVIQVVCEYPGCGQELAYIGYKWVHLQKLPPDRDHQAQPVQTR